MGETSIGFRGNEELTDLVLTCREDFDNPNISVYLETLCRQIKNIVSSEKIPTVCKVEPWNSIRVTLKISSEAAQRLHELAERGDASLANLGILSLQVRDDRIILQQTASDREVTERAVQSASSCESFQASSSTSTTSLEVSSYSSTPNKVSTVECNDPSRLMNRGISSSTLLLPDSVTCLPSKRHHMAERWQMTRDRFASVPDDTVEGRMSGMCAANEDGYLASPWCLPSSPHWSYPYTGSGGMQPACNTNFNSMSHWRAEHSAVQQPMLEDGNVWRNHGRNSVEELMNLESCKRTNSGQSSYSFDDPSIEEVTPKKRKRTKKAKESSVDISLNNQCIKGRTNNVGSLTSVGAEMNAVLDHANIETSSGNYVLQLSEMSRMSEFTREQVQNSTDVLASSSCWNSMPSMLNSAITTGMNQCQQIERESLLRPPPNPIIAVQSEILANQMDHLIHTSSSSGAGVRDSGAAHLETQSACFSEASTSFRHFCSTMSGLLPRSSSLTSICSTVSNTTQNALGRANSISSSLPAAAASRLPDEVVLPSAASVSTGAGPAFTNSKKAVEHALSVLFDDDEDEESMKLDFDIILANDKSVASTSHVAPNINATLTSRAKRCKSNKNMTTGKSLSISAITNAADHTSALLTGAEITSQFSTNYKKSQKSSSVALYNMSLQSDSKCGIESGTECPSPSDAVYSHLSTGDCLSNSLLKGKLNVTSKCQVHDFNAESGFPSSNTRTTGESVVTVSARAKYDSRPEGELLGPDSNSSLHQGYNVMDDGEIPDDLEGIHSSDLLDFDSSLVEEHSFNTVRNDMNAMISTSATDILSSVSVQKSLAHKIANRPRRRKSTGRAVVEEPWSDGAGAMVGALSGNVSLSSSCHLPLSPSLMIPVTSGATPDSLSKTKALKPCQQPDYPSVKHATKALKPCQQPDYPSVKHASRVQDSSQMSSDALIGLDMSSQLISLQSAACSSVESDSDPCRSSLADSGVASNTSLSVGSDTSESERTPVSETTAAGSSVPSSAECSLTAVPSSQVESVAVSSGSIKISSMLDSLASCSQSLDMPCCAVTVSSPVVLDVRSSCGDALTSWTTAAVIDDSNRSFENSNISMANTTRIAPPIPQKRRNCTKNKQGIVINLPTNKQQNKLSGKCFTLPVSSSSLLQQAGAESLTSRKFAIKSLLSYSMNSSTSTVTSNSLNSISGTTGSQLPIISPTFPQLLSESVQRAMLGAVTSADCDEENGQNSNIVHYAHNYTNVNILQAKIAKSKMTKESNGVMPEASCASQYTKTERMSGKALLKADCVDESTTESKNSAECRDGSDLPCVEQTSSGSPCGRSASVFGDPDMYCLSGCDGSATDSAEETSSALEKPVIPSHTRTVIRLAKAQSTVSQARDVNQWCIQPSNNCSIETRVSPSQAAVDGNLHARPSSRRENFKSIKNGKRCQTAVKDEMHDIVKILKLDPASVELKYDSGDGIEPLLVEPKPVMNGLLAEHSAEYSHGKPNLNQATSISKTFQIVNSKQVKLPVTENRKTIRAENTSQETTNISPVRNSNIDRLPSCINTTVKSDHVTASADSTALNNVCSEKLNSDVIVEDLRASSASDASGSCSPANSVSPVASRPSSTVGGNDEAKMSVVVASLKAKLAHGLKFMTEANAADSSSPLVRNKRTKHAGVDTVESCSTSGTDSPVDDSSTSNCLSNGECRVDGNIILTPPSNVESDVQDVTDKSTLERNKYSADSVVLESEGTAVQNRVSQEPVQTGCT